MKVLRFRKFSGPNIYLGEPLLIMRLDLEELAERESCSVPGFVDRLVDLLPGLRAHHCSRGHAGGFVERLREGTYFGHIVEHVALELSDPAGISAYYGKTVSTETPGVYDIHVEFRSEPGMRALLLEAVDLVSDLVAGRPHDYRPAVASARELAVRTGLGPSSAAILAAADRKGIPWTRVGEHSLVRLGHGKHRKYLQAAVTGETSYIAGELASDKDATKQLLEEGGLPVPRGRAVRSEAEAVEALRDL